MSEGREPIVGLILAGGAGRRLGGTDKARLRLGNCRLIEIVHARMSQSVDRVLLSRAAPDPPLGVDADLLLDRMDGPKGPTAALFALVATTTSLPGSLMVATTAVDTPLLPADWVERLAVAVRTSPGAGAALAVHQEAHYFTQAVWRLACLRRQCAPLGRNDAPSLSSLFPTNRVEVNFPDADNPFANANTLAELRALGHRAAVARQRG